MVSLVDELDDSADALEDALPSTSVPAGDGDGVLDTASIELAIELAVELAVELVDALPERFNMQSTNRHQAG